MLFSLLSIPTVCSSRWAWRPVKGVDVFACEAQPYVLRQHERAALGVVPLAGHMAGLLCRSVKLVTGQQCCLPVAAAPRKALGVGGKSRATLNSYSQHGIASVFFTFLFRPPVEAQHPSDQCLVLCFNTAIRCPPLPRALPQHLLVTVLYYLSSCTHQTLLLLLIPFANVLTKVPSVTSKQS